jgi:type III secretion protein C
MNHRWASALGALIVAFSLFSGVAKAGTVPNFERVISMRASDQPVAAFLEELFSQIDLPVNVTAGIDGKVNGKFENKTAEEIFTDISRSFALTVYFDGAVAHVYRSSELSQRILAIPSRVALQVIRSARDLNMIDERNFLQSARNGGLVISGTRRFIEQVEELVAAAQSNLSEYKAPLTFRVFYLKYAWAQDVDFNFSGRRITIPGVASIVSFLAEDGSWTSFGGGYSNSAYDNASDQNLDGLLGQGLQSQGSNSGHLGIGPINATSGNFFMGARNQGHYDRGDVRIAVDPRLNAVIVRDSPERMPYYESLIKSLDLEPQMVEIEATIIDINTSRLRDLGINWRGIDDDYEALFGRGNTSDLALRPAVNDITPQGDGGFLSFVLGDSRQFVARINALEKQGAAKVVSSPHVLTLSNVEALFNTSETFYVRVAGEEQVDLFSVSVGTSLRVTPHVFSDKGIDKLKLLVTIDDGQQESQRVDDIPVVTRSVINTQALIDSNESVLIGGLVREATINSESKVPLLGSIPVVGNLFKYKNDTTERVERMFLISPRLSVRRLNTDSVPILESNFQEDIKVSDYFYLKRQRVPEYPTAAQQDQIEGHCLVEYKITKEGKTTDVEALDCSHDEFIDVSIKAIEEFEYSALKSDSDMITIPNVKARFVFQLERG